MTKVLLIAPPTVYARGSYSSPATPPLGLAYLAGALRAAGHQPYLLDALAEGIQHHGDSYSKLAKYCGLPNNQIANRVGQIIDAAAGIDLIAVTAMFTQDWPHVRSMIDAVHTEYPGIPVIVGGEHASSSAEYILNSSPSVALIGRGEGEDTIVEVAEWCDGTRPISDIAGVSYRGTNGEVVANPARPRILDITALARPAWDLVDIDAYNSEGGRSYGVNRGRTMPILATRGCPYRCTFCSSPGMWGTRYVMRDVADVVDEIEEYTHTYQATNIDFYDLTAVVKKSWILGFCDELNKRGVKVTWQLPSGTRSEALDDEVLKAMRGAGCHNVTYAPESGSVRTLEIIKKKVSLDKMLTSIRAAIANDISPKCNLIIGFPHETHRDVLATLWLAVKLAWIGTSDTGIYLFSPYPGSALHDELRAAGKIPEMGDAYFESLLGYMDIRAKSSFCDKVSTRQLSLYRTVGMSLFYGISYLRHPQWIVRTWRNLAAGTPESLFEDRIGAFIRRR